MIEIKDLLHRFEKILGHESVKINIVQGVLKNHFSILVEKQQIVIKGKTLFFKIKPVFRNEILIHKEKFLRLLKDEGILIENIF
ncbi:MAG: hypothetical protein ACKOW9_00910 [Candidatus Paceibacterota bacterium]